jgi:hypothetical protein
MAEKSRPFRKPQRPRQGSSSGAPAPAKTRVTNPTPSATQFPAAWLWFVDEAIPTYVKKQYSPREAWKNKPFSKEDAQFFSRGIEELSELFTEERPRRMPAYFNHPKFRSSYLLYFLPLQAAKFLTVFEMHPRALQAALEHGRAQGVLRIADLGAGPGTASLAFLLKLLSLKLESGQELPPIELDWLDTNTAIMQDGKALAEQIAENFSRLRGKVTVRTHSTPWWDVAREVPNETSLLLLGHVLNEAPGPASESGMRLWSQLLKDRARGGGTLMIEPAARVPSQHLAQLRDQIFESELLPRSPQSVWGPCLHAEKCPLADGRDWCHFSVPTHIPGVWFKGFSKRLGSERQWVKFSYLWLASEGAWAPMPDPKLRRVVSDPLTTDRNTQAPRTVLLCEPEVVGRMSVPSTRLVWRGDLVPAPPKQEPRATGNVRKWDED